MQICPGGAYAGPALPRLTDIERAAIAPHGWRYRDALPPASPRCWYSVDTPAVFREYELPAAGEAMTRKDRNQLAELETIAERHGTRIVASATRRG